MWTLVVSGGMFLVSMVLWGLLSLLGDVSGALVARVISLLFGIVTGLGLFALVILLGRLQLIMLESEEMEHEP